MDLFLHKVGHHLEKVRPILRFGPGLSADSVQPFEKVPQNRQSADCWTPRSRSVEAAHAFTRGGSGPGRPLRVSVGPAASQAEGGSPGPDQGWVGAGLRASAAWPRGPSGAGGPCPCRFESGRCRRGWRPRCPPERRRRRSAGSWAPRWAPRCCPGDGR